MITKLMPISDEQQDFRKNRSTIDTIFTIRQEVEKSIEFDKPAFMCFINLTKAFDQIKLSDVAAIMGEAGVPEDIVKIIEALNSNTMAQILVNDILTEKIKTSE